MAWLSLSLGILRGFGSPPPPEPPPPLPPEEEAPAGFVGLTFGVAYDIFEQLRSSLGHEWDILVLSLGSALLYKLAKSLQSRAERALFVQILLGGPTGADEDIMGGDGPDENMQYQAMRQGLDPEELDGGMSRASYYAMLQRQEDAQRLVEDVRAYAARRALESGNPLRWLFPLPKLRVTSAIDAATLGDDEAEETRELNASTAGVPLMTATVLPASGSSSVVVVEGVPLFRLPFVWLTEGSSSQSLFDRLQESVPSRLVAAFEGIMKRYAGSMPNFSGGGMGGFDEWGNPGFGGSPFGGGGAPRRQMGRGKGGNRGMRGRGGRGGGGGGGGGSELGKRFADLGKGPDVSGPEGSVVLSCFSWNAGLLRQVIDDARRLAAQRRGRSCEVRKLSKSDNGMGGRWGGGGGGSFFWQTLEAPPRKLTTVFLSKGAEELLVDIDAFLRRRAWYAKRAIKYQRVYLLHGPPGNGKSSFLQALAVQYGLPLFVMQLSGGGVTKTECRRLLSDTADQPCILAVEDAESCFVAPEKDEDDDDGSGAQYGGYGGGPMGMYGGRGRAPRRAMGGMYGRGMGMGGMDDTSKPVTAKQFASLLCSEAERNPSGRLVIFTTNTIGMLDTALQAVIREQGLEVEFPPCNASVQKRVWANFYGGVEGCDTQHEAYVAQLAAISKERREPLPTFGVSAFQGYLMRFRDSPSDAASRENIERHLAPRDPHKQALLMPKREVSAADGAHDPLHRWGGGSRRILFDTTLSPAAASDEGGAGDAELPVMLMPRRAKTTASPGRGAVSRGGFGPSRSCSEEPQAGGGATAPGLARSRSCGAGVKASTQVGGDELVEAD